MRNTDEYQWTKLRVACLLVSLNPGHSHRICMTTLQPCFGTSMCRISPTALFSFCTPMSNYNIGIFPTIHLIHVVSRIGEKPSAERDTARIAQRTKKQAFAQYPACSEGTCTKSNHLSSTASGRSIALELLEPGQQRVQCSGGLM